MNTKRISIVILALLMLSNVTLLASVKAVAWPNLPATPVQLTVVDGTPSTTYFISTLSGVPVGFDVQNGVYPGWCVDKSEEMIRSVSHNVILYSSLSPPAALSGINWSAINYILNHKQGEMIDVQHAIWWFTDSYTPWDPDTIAMIAGANAHPGYVPTTGEILAVICLALDNDPYPYYAQDSIIELVVPPEQGEGLSPGYWKHNVNVANGGRGSYSGDPHITLAQLQAYAAYIATNFHPGFDLAEAQQIFQNNKQHAQWLTVANWFNAAAGLSPYVED
jgi:hypothetical protein